MALRQLPLTTVLKTSFSYNSSSKLQHASTCRLIEFPRPLKRRRYTTESSPTPASPKSIPAHPNERSRSPSGSSAASTTSSTPSKPTPSSPSVSTSNSSLGSWEEEPNFNISAFSQLPQGTSFGVNQHMKIDDEFKEALRQVLWQFRAPIRYAFAYGSGVFPQTGSRSSADKSSIHPAPNAAITKAQTGGGKMIDFIFGVSYTQHWHSLNLQQHRDHYSGVGSLGSGFVSRVQDQWGAGVYFNPYVTVNGTMIKYGVVNLDTLCTDLSEWSSLYLAGRLHKPVKILRDDPRVRLANQINLISAVRTALLLLPESFTEEQLYGTIAGISYMGDLRMALPTENPHKVANIVRNQLANFRRLYAPLIDTLPNVMFKDPRCSDPKWMDDAESNCTLQQDMNPQKRSNMVRRLPKAFREKLFFRYQEKFQIPRRDFNKMMEENVDEDEQGIKRRQGGRFEQRIAEDEDLKKSVGEVIKKTIGWPSAVQSIKGIMTAGTGRTIRYVSEKMQRAKEGKAEKAKAEIKEAEKSVMPQAVSKNDLTKGATSKGGENGEKK